ncbi:MAG: acyl-ACP--UDP-N-acetylglucosamine O-acyltransferase [Paracoccaceae bacterium]
MTQPIDPSATVHATASIAKGARIGAHSRIGPFCVVGPRANLEAGVVLDSHVVVSGHTHIGRGTRVWPFASLGSEPQDLKFKGEETRVLIGRDNMIREYVTINPGTGGGGGVTRIGDGNLLMMQVHVAHDCQVGDGVIFANGVQVAGHVTIGDHAVLGSMAGIHQHCRIGRGAMIGGGAIVVNDVIPFATVVSPRGTLGGLNLIGLRRRGVDKSQVNDLRRAYKTLFFGDGEMLERARDLAADASDAPLVQEVLEFMLSHSDRAFCTPDRARE